MDNGRAQEKLYLAALTGGCDSAQALKIACEKFPVANETPEQTVTRTTAAMRVLRELYPTSRNLL